MAALLGREVLTKDYQTVRFRYGDFARLDPRQQGFDGVWCDGVSLRRHFQSSPLKVRSRNCGKHSVEFNGGLGLGARQMVHLLVKRIKLLYDASLVASAVPRHAVLVRRRKTIVSTNLDGVAAAEVRVVERLAGQHTARVTLLETGRIYFKGTDLIGKAV
jgi:hypothetical protein